MGVEVSFIPTAEFGFFFLYGPEPAGMAADWSLWDGLGLQGKERMVDMREKLGVRFVISVVHSSAFHVC